MLFEKPRFLEKFCTDPKYHSWKGSAFSTKISNCSVVAQSLPLQPLPIHTKWFSWHSETNLNPSKLCCRSIELFTPSKIVLFLGHLVAFSLIYSLLCPNTLCAGENRLCGSIIMCIVSEKCQSLKFGYCKTLQHPLETLNIRSGLCKIFSRTSKTLKDQNQVLQNFVKTFFLTIKLNFKKWVLSLFLQDLLFLFVPSGPDLFEVCIIDMWIKKMRFSNGAGVVPAGILSIFNHVLKIQSLKTWFSSQAKQLSLKIKPKKLTKEMVLKAINLVAKEKKYRQGQIS